MSSQTSDVGLADLFTVLRTLPVTEQAHLEIVGDLLGLGDIRLEESSCGQKTIAADPLLRSRHKESLASSKQNRPPARPSIPFVNSKPSGKPLMASMNIDESAEEVVADQPVWLRSIPVDVEEKIGNKPMRMPLFHPSTVNGVLSAALRTRIVGRRIDDRRLLDRVVQAKPLFPVPRLPEATLLHGTQLLLGQHDSMVPFYEDFSDLIGSLKQLLGETKLEVFKFRSHPNEASYWTRQGQKVWKAIGGRPVMLVTDFGLGDSSDNSRTISKSRWTKFAQELKQCGCPLVSLVPMPPGNWPAWVAQDFNAIHWDPRTRAEALQKRFGIGHEVSIV